MKPSQLIKCGTNVLLFTGISLTLQAQKLNSVQEASIWVPDNIKIDGKLNEWNDTFQAYNKSTLIYYTLANDDKNLYLAIKCTSQFAGNKIIVGGINFTVNPAGKKSEKDAGIIVFPVANKSSLRNQFLAVRPVGASGGQTQADSIETADMHREAVNAAKEIKLSGIKEIADSVIAIYNEYGIKAAINYNEKGNFTYELAVPLKYLNLTAATPFTYQIKLNGIQQDNNMYGGAGFAGGAPAAVVDRIDRSDRTTGSIGGSVGAGGVGSKGMDDIQNMYFPTDFWGKYTLAKK